MSERREQESGGVRRRQFMLRATSALGAAALAGLLGGPEVAEGAAPGGEDQGLGLFEGPETTQFTGIFLGARGQLTSTRHPAGGYTQVFALLT